MVLWVQKPLDPLPMTWPGEGVHGGPSLGAAGYDRGTHPIGICVPRRHGLQPRSSLYFRLLRELRGKPGPRGITGPRVPVLPLFGI